MNFMKIMNLTIMKTIFRKKMKKGRFDDEERISKKLNSHEKYGNLSDFFKHPAAHFETEPSLSFISGTILAVFVFILYYFLFLRQITLFDLLTDFIFTDDSTLTFFESAILCFKSAETVLLFLLFFFFLPFIYYSEKHQRKIDAAEEIIPSLLRDLADLIGGGLTLQEALIELTEIKSSEFADKREASDLFLREIRLIGLKMKSGVSFETCLEDLGKRYDSKLIQRAASVIDAAEKSGGKPALSLEAAAFDLQEAVNMKKERRSKQGVYGTVLFLSFFLFIGIVILLIHQFRQMSDMTAQTLDPTSVFETAVIIYHMLLIQSIFAGATVGKFTTGTAIFGLKYSFGLMFTVWAAFWVAGIF
jgi:Flp pilus assembly protein TadC